MPGVQNRAPADHRAGAELEELSVRAVTVAATDLGLVPLALAQELAQGEIGLLITYLDAAAGSVEDLELRSRIAALLHRLTAWTQAAG